MKNFIDDRGVYSIRDNSIQTLTISCDTQITGNLVVSGTISGSSISGSFPTSENKITYLDGTGGNAQYYSVTSSIMRGSDNFVVAVFFRPEFKNNENGSPILQTGDASSNGWNVQYAFDTFFVRVATSSGAIEYTLNSAVGGFIGTPGYKHQRDIVILFQVYQSTNTNVTIWANGGRMYNVEGATTGVVVGTDNLTYIGRNSLASVAHGGFAYKDGTVTDAQISDFFESCYDNKKISNSGISWDYLWSVEDTVPGTTWESSVGSATLVRTGSQLPTITPKMRWA